MKLKNRFLIFPLIIMWILLTLTNSCKKDKTDEITYSTNDITGVWSGNVRVVFYGGTLNGLDTIRNMKVTFGPNGSFIKMEGSPVYLSILGNLAVGETGKIDGIITTTHLTDSVNIETTTMNWEGSTFETKTKINTNMNWPWVNTSPGSGHFYISGPLIKQ